MRNKLVVCHLRDLVHLCPRRTPRVVGCGISYFGLHIGVAFGVVLCNTNDSFPEVLHCRHSRWRWWLKLAGGAQSEMTVTAYYRARESGMETWPPKKSLDYKHL